MAQKELLRAIFDFIDGAAEDEVSRTRNRTQFDEVMFRPQVFRDVSKVNQSVELLGRNTLYGLIAGSQAGVDQ
ncbi:MAG: alpha-hydroxy-acid oxidizing protein [Fimbriimonadaceae bacterium]|nr:alpha-hydroxy-acid oxidizing protein [Alphaproteobacteria bacterium]